MVAESGNAETMVSFECEGSTAESWTVQSATLTEKLNRTYELLVSLATDEMVAEPVQMLGKSCSLTITRNQFRCIPSSVPFRPMRLTQKPGIVSVQTATVVGPSGAEIHTDEHGRIKVQFHWDRLGESDENSSGWMRVMQPWGGPGWGFDGASVDLK